MILVPFDQRFAADVMPYFYDREYADFARCLGRWLTIDEAQNLPRAINAEVLLIMSANGHVAVTGMVILREMFEGVITLGMVVRKELQNSGIGHAALKESERYIFEVRNARLCIVETLSRNDNLGFVMERRGYGKCGEIPKYHIVNGIHENVMIYCKDKDSWFQSKN